MRIILLFIAIMSICIAIIPIFAINISDVNTPDTITPVVAPSGISMPSDKTSSPIIHSPPVISKPNLVWEESFLVLDEATGKVNKVSAFDYTLGALAAEMPPSFHPEALAAQAAAAYTRASYCKAQQELNPDPALKGAHLTGIPSKNMGYITPENLKTLYGENYKLYYPALEKAAKFGSSHLIAFEEAPILAAYHAISAQQTEACENVWDRSIPYLTPVESQGDYLAPQYETEVSFADYELKKLLEAAFNGLNLKIGDETNWIIPQNHSPGGYVLEAKVGDMVVTGKEIRKALDLRSAAFNLTYGQGAFHFLVTGYGHGVGFSQYGADFMGRQGSTATEILEYYYPSAKVIEK